MLLDSNVLIIWAHIRACFSVNVVTTAKSAGGSLLQYWKYNLVRVNEKGSPAFSLDRFQGSELRFLMSISTVHWSQVECKWICCIYKFDPKVCSK